jgi:hypothetical protein
MEERCVAVANFFQNFASVFTRQDVRDDAIERRE